MKKPPKESIKNPEKGKKKERQKRSEDVPYGREAVKKAILEATQKLLLKKSPNDISVREIAQAANIKHPLIHRHFGTKSDLIREAHTILITKINAEIPFVENIQGNAKIFFQAVKDNKMRQLALARAMIEGVSPHVIQTEFPVMQRLIKLLKKRAAESDTEKQFSPEMLAAMIGAMALGWILYEPFLLAAAKLENEDKEEIQQQVVEILEEFIKKIC